MCARVFARGCVLRALVIYYVFNGVYYGLSIRGVLRIVSRGLISNTGPVDRIPWASCRSARLALLPAVQKWRSSLGALCVEVLCQQLRVVFVHWLVVPCAQHFWAQSWSWLQVSEFAPAGATHTCSRPPRGEFCYLHSDLAKSSEAILHLHCPKPN